MKMSDAELKEARENNCNCDEGHLGGYIRASPEPAPSGLNVEHGDPATWIPKLWLWAHEVLGVRSILDVGCGEGHCARFFQGLGCDVLGIDGSAQAKRDSVIADRHIKHDFVSGPYELNRQFDLVWSCEFVEHVEEQYCDNFLSTFRSSQKYIMMTYAVPAQEGWHHVNCQPESYWIKKLELYGFQFDPELTRESRSQAEPEHFHYKDRGLVFVAGS